MRINPFFLHGEELTPVRKLLALKALAGSVPLTEYTVTGNPVSFLTNVAKPLSVVAAFSPVQTGSGDPSPENIRPITGFTGANVYLSPTDADDPAKQTFAVTFPQEVGTAYGGTVDLTTGVLTVTWEKAYLKDLRWINFGGMITFQAQLNKDKYTHVMSDYFPAINGNPALDQQIGEYANGANYAATILFRKDGMTSVQDFVDWLNDLEYPACIAFKMGTPLVYQLTPTEILSLIGNNVLWSDLNGDLTVIYKKKG